MSRQLCSLRSFCNVGIWSRSYNKISSYDRCSIRRLLCSTSTDNGAAEQVIQNDNILPRVFVCQSQYQSIMKYYVNKGDVISVEHIMAEMDRGGIPPNITTINMLLSAHAAKKDGLGAQIVFDEMQKVGIRSNNQSLGILMNAYANQGDFTTVDKVLHTATAAADANLDTELMNEVMRTNVVSGNPMGAESVLEGIKELGLEPNAETMNILVKAYASVGDVQGAIKVLTRIGSAVRTCEVNSALAAALKSPNMDHWDTVVKLHQEYFSSEKLNADNETYEQFILLCEKYKRPDDALVWFEDFVSQGNTVTDAITRAFGAAVDEATFNEHAKRNFYDKENLDDTLVNYRQLLALTPVSESATGFAPAFVGNTTEVYNLLQSRIRAPADSTELKILVEKHISLGDLQGARQVISIAAAEANYPNSATIFSLMQGYASHGDCMMAENLFEESRLHGTTNQNISIMNEVLRSYSVAGETGKAEDAFDSIPYLGLIPDGNSALNLLMGYANIGDFRGIERSIEKIAAVGYIPTTECGNYVLKSVVMDNTGITWDEFTGVFQKYFGPEGLTADNETYTQLLLACIKYNHKDEAITFFNDLLTSGATLSPILRNIFRQVVDCEEFSAEHPDIPDTWIPVPGSPNPRGADHLPQFHLLWGSSPKRTRRSMATRPDTTLRKLSFDKVNGIDDDSLPPPKSVMYHDLDTLKKTLKARDDAGQTNIGPYVMTQFIAAYSDLKDPDTAYKLLQERELMGFNCDRNVYRAMCKAFADVGDYEKVKEVYIRFTTTYKGQTTEYEMYFQYIRAFCIYGDPEGAMQAFKWIRQQNLRGSIESIHVIMMSYASLGNMEGCLGTFSKFKEHAFYANTTTINIMLAAILYSSNPIFNRRMFFQLLESHFGTGDLVEDRCTYAHVLLGCQKAGDKIFAMKTFDQFLLTKLRITLKMRNTLRTLLGEGEFNAYISNLDNGDRKRLRNVDEDEATFREKNTFVPGNVDAVVTLPAVLGGKRVYNYIAKTEPYKTPGKTNPSGVRDYNPPQQDWTPFSARADPNRKQWSPSDGAKSVQKPKIKWGPSSKVN